jgi:hypothetical protein
MIRGLHRGLGRASEQARHASTSVFTSRGWCDPADYWWVPYHA